MPDQFFALTESERVVLVGLAAGRHPTDLAKEMVIAPQTVANHARNIAEKVALAVALSQPPDDEPGEGGAGVREPRRPLPPAPSAGKTVDE